jgi:hypothetical protein
MGLFLFVAAIKISPMNELLKVIMTFLIHQRIRSTLMNGQEWRSYVKQNDTSPYNLSQEAPSLTSLHTTTNDWTVITFNNCPYDEKEACKYLSVELRTLTSLIQVYDSDVWYHHVYYNGKLVDQFCSSPEIYETREGSNRYEGNAKKLAFYFEVDEHIIAPYLVQFDSKSQKELENIKAHHDDEFPLKSEWIFLDFWKRLGIDYPKSFPDFVIMHYSD